MSFGDMLEGLAGNFLQGQSPDHANVAGSLLEMLNSSQGGGLQGLVQAFHGNGLGNLVNSWIGSGQNLPVSGAQIESVLGNDAIQALAAKTGLNPCDVSSKLSQVLPGLIDHLTPNGSVPHTGGLVSGGMGFLQSMTAAAGASSDASAPSDSSSDSDSIQDSASESSSSSIDDSDSGSDSN